MRLSQYPISTLKEVPGDAEIVSPKPDGSAGTRASFWIPAT